jgi:hypothetical protein
MATRLQSVASTDAMRNYALGFVSDTTRNIALADAMYLVGNAVPVGSTFEYQAYAAGDTITIPNTLTAINDPIGARIGYGGTKVTGTLDVHRATTDVFYTGPRVTDADLLMKLENQARASAQMLVQGRAKRVIDAAMTAAGAGTGINVASTSTNAVDLVQQAIETVMLKSQNVGNIRVLFGTTAFRKFANHVSVQGRLNGGATRKDPSTPSEQQLADLLGYGVEVRQSRAMFNSANIGQTPVETFTLADSILVASVSPAPNTLDPSALKLFVGYGDNDFIPKYRLAHGNDAEFEEATWGWSEKVIVANSAAIARLNITTS